MTVAEGKDRPERPPAPRRTVHYYDHGLLDKLGPRGHDGLGAGPYLAHVEKIWPSGLANLVICRPFGPAYFIEHIPQQGPATESSQRYWEWPPAS